MQPAVTVTVSADDDDDDDDDADVQMPMNVKADGGDGPDYNAFAPGNDADYFIEDDADGRFYGGGLSSTQKQILDIFDENDDNGDTPADGSGAAAAQKLTVTGVRRQLLALERAINKNAEMRVKWAGQPEK